MRAFWMVALLCLFLVPVGALPAQADQGLKQLEKLYQASRKKNPDCVALLRAAEEVMAQACTKLAYAEARAFGAQMFNSFVCKYWDSSHLPIGYEGAYDEAKVKRTVMDELLAASEYGSSWAPVEALLRVIVHDEGTDSDVKKAVHYLAKSSPPVIARYKRDRETLRNREGWDQTKEGMLNDLRKSRSQSDDGAKAAQDARDMTKQEVAKMFDEALSTNVYFEPIFVPPSGC